MKCRPVRRGIRIGAAKERDLELQVRHFPTTGDSMSRREDLSGKRHEHETCIVVGREEMSR